MRGEEQENKRLPDEDDGYDGAWRGNRGKKKRRRSGGGMAEDARLMW